MDKWIARLTPADAEAYRSLMLYAYESEPTAFTATVAEREDLPLEFWISRVSDVPDPDQMVFGAFVDGEIVGVTGLRYQRRPRTRHAALLFGTFVLRPFRRLGLGRTLVRTVVQQAKESPGVTVVKLTVTESNGAAIHLYESCGFSAFGVEPLANKLGDEYVSLLHMWRRVDPEGE